ncbi:hypothetical protein CBR_g51063 [Chara braunii]|uniref:AIR9-like A9 domain-containing protein n=1 Tax=Chara braunii TaxID=69332 RepID=A0A388K5Y5_CHABU|nr:hypothetical protein CBR_g51063 [Chara braunii]|eukprot:GBG65468.1 hypothetical protein CBR_g51063 [Chara braunii]
MERGGTSAVHGPLPKRPSTALSQRGKSPARRPTDGGGGGAGGGSPLSSTTSSRLGSSLTRGASKGQSDKAEVKGHAAGHGVGTENRKGMDNHSHKSSTSSGHAVGSNSNRPLFSRVPVNGDGVSLGSGRSSSRVGSSLTKSSSSVRDAGLSRAAHSAAQSAIRSPAHSAASRSDNGTANGNKMTTRETKTAAIEHDEPPRNGNASPPPPPPHLPLPAVRSASAEVVTNGAKDAGVVANGGKDAGVVANGAKDAGAVANGAEDAEEDGGEGCERLSSPNGKLGGAVNGAKDAGAVANGSKDAVAAANGAKDAGVAANGTKEAAAVGNGAGAVSETGVTTTMARAGGVKGVVSKKVSGKGGQEIDGGGRRRVSASREEGHGKRVAGAVGGVGVGVGGGGGGGGGGGIGGRSVSKTVGGNSANAGSPGSGLHTARINSKGAAQEGNSHSGGVGGGGVGIVKKPVSDATGSSGSVKRMGEGRATTTTDGRGTSTTDGRGTPTGSRSNGSSSSSPSVGEGSARSRTASGGTKPSGVGAHHGAAWGGGGGGGGAGGTKRLHPSSPNKASAVSSSARRASFSVSSTSSLDKHSHSTAANSALRRRSLPAAGASSGGGSQGGHHARSADETSLDLRSQKIRTLNSELVNLTPKVEFVYLRDNRLHSFQGAEVFLRVKLSSLVTLPVLPNLEFLSISQNELTSLEMPSQPKLQVLVASKNRIRSLLDLPHLPVLENLRFEDNPVAESENAGLTAMLLVGKSLKKLNGREISPEAEDEVLAYPPHTAICLRSGWEMCGVEQASESTWKFLQEWWSRGSPPGFSLIGAKVEQPVEDDPCTCNIEYEVELSIADSFSMKYRWYEGPRNGLDFTLIENAEGKEYWPRHEDVGKCLKIECIPQIGGKEYPSFFAMTPEVKAGSGCPKLLEIKVEGTPMEGCTVKGVVKIAWCGGVPANGVIRWWRCQDNECPVTIPGAEESEYTLTLEDVAHHVWFMYTPVTKAGVKGEGRHAETEVVIAAPPSVTDVQVVGRMTQGCTVKGVGKYTGGVEGESELQWLREDKDTGVYILVKKGSSEYQLSEEDVGAKIMFQYTPVNSEGVKGECQSVTTPVATLAPPRVVELNVLGDVREGSTLSVTGKYVGGDEGPSRIQWFKTKHKSEDNMYLASELEPISNSRVAREFCVPLEAVGYYLVAKYTPYRVNGEAGEPMYVTSPGPVEMLPPCLTSLFIKGTFVEGETITASYGYVGGYEGRSKYTWSIHKEKSDPGKVVWNANDTQYKLTLDDVGHFISFRCTPRREDGMEGESKVAMSLEVVQAADPTITSLRVRGNAIEGAELVAEKEYFGGHEGDSVYQWFMVDANGKEDDVEGKTEETFRLRKEHIDHWIGAKCTPVRNGDGAEGPTVKSDTIGPIKPAYPRCEHLMLEGGAVEGEKLTFFATYSGGYVASPSF